MFPTFMLFVQLTGSPGIEDKNEIDNRSIYVGNVSYAIFVAFWGHFVFSPTYQFVMGIAEWFPSTFDQMVDDLNQPLY